MSDDVPARNSQPAEGPLSGDDLDKVTGGVGMTPDGQPTLPPPRQTVGLPTSANSSPPNSQSTPGDDG